MALGLVWGATSPCSLNLSFDGWRWDATKFSQFRFFLVLGVEMGNGTGRVLSKAFKTLQALKVRMVAEGSKLEWEQSGDPWLAEAVLPHGCRAWTHSEDTIALFVPNYSRRQRSALKKFRTHQQGESELVVLVPHGEFQTLLRVFKEISPRSENETAPTLR